MDKLTYLKVIASIAVFISLLLALFLLTVKTKNKLENKLFAVFLIINAIDTSGFFICNFITNINLETFRMSAYLLEMPLFYLYVNAVCYSDFKLKPKHLLHAIPFAIANLVLVPRLYLADGINKRQFYEHLAQTPELYFYQILGELQYIFYIVCILLILKKYKKIYLENYTNANNTLSYKWLFQLTVALLIIHSIIIIKNLLRYTSYNYEFIWMNVITGIAVLLTTCWFILKVLNNPELFRGIDSRLQLSKDFINSPEIENKINEPKNNQIELLRNFMIEHEPFLDPSLTIHELSNEIKIPVRELSVLINHHINQHFFDFVNEYRIQKAMTILKDPTKKDLTVSEILYQVGFNSKSSFNTSFRKYTNQTPTMFKNN
jgi:AraC-like DNA-binding protein